MRSSRDLAARDAAALTLLALVVNLVRLGTKSIAFDEAGSVLYARLSFESLPRTVLGRDPNMALYYFLLNLWVRVFGESEWAVRVPSALFGALAVGAIYLLGRHLYGRAAGVVAGLLLALNPFMVQFAQTARSYSLVVLLVTLSSYALAREIERPSTANRVGYTVASVLAVYAHYFTVYILAVHLLIVAASRSVLPVRRWMGVAAVVLLSSAPAVIIAYRSRAGSRIDWIPPPVLIDVANVLATFTGGSRVLLGALAGGGCYAAILGWRERRAWPHRFVATWLLVPIALSFLVSLAKPMFQARYLILCLPALILFGAAGIARIRPPVVAAAFVALLACVSATRLVDFYGREAVENWRAAAQLVVDSTRPDDGLVFFPSWAANPFGYYMPRRGLPAPPKLDRSALAAKPRVWFVVRLSDVAGNRSQFLQLQSSLRETSRLAERRSFAGVAVELYVR